MSGSRIVAGTDFSLPAEHALEVAVNLARALGAELTLVHAYEVPVLGFPETSFVPGEDVRRELGALAKAGLDACVGRYENRGVALRAVVKIGAPWLEVNAVATQEGAELVVVGSRGRRAFSRFLLGSVAERVVRTATCPVLLVPEAAGTPVETSSQPPRHVLIALHFGAHSERALDVGIDLAERLGAKLTLAHVASDALEAGLARARRRIPDAQGILTAGSPAKEILAVARAQAADLLVLGTHGRKGLPRMFLGSVAEKVARRAEVPVLIVSSHDRSGPAVTSS